MNNIKLFSLLCLLAISCSKSKNGPPEPGDNTVTMTIGSTDYSFSTVPDASANYYDVGAGVVEFRLNGTDGVSFVKIRISYIYNPSAPFSISAGSGGPSVNTGMGSIEFTDKAGVLYKLKTVVDDPWFRGTVTSIQDDVWTGTFGGYVNNPEGASFDIRDGQFKVKVMRK
ncbi:MAG: hypothetical protein JNL51_08970 [Chitinophagaceae bacterium]|nr:hypothetical protein [Chitinophagaceae bacterium]